MGNVIRTAVVMVLCLSGLSVCFAGVTGDVNGDFIVEWSDLAVMAQQWLGSGSTDLNVSGSVEFRDYAMLTGNWLNTGPIDPNLVMWFNMDENRGTVAHDSSGYNHNGTLNGGAAWSPAGGRLGGAQDNTSGSTNRIDVSTAGMSVAAGTISMWVKPITSSGYRFMFSHRNDSAGGCRTRANWNTISSPSSGSKAT